MRLEQPVRQYLLGKLPSHSSSGNLGKNFGIDKEMMFSLLKSAGVMTPKNTPNKQAVKLGFIDSCGNNVIWNLDEVEKLLKKAGLKPVRQYMNQELPDAEEDAWASLKTIGTYFDVGGVTVGKWLKNLGYRDEKGNPPKSLLKNGKALKVEMKDNNQVRVFYKWNLLWTLEKLQEAGHLFDFDYAKSLKGTGQSSDVQVTTVKDRARETAKRFVELYNKPATRRDAIRLMERQNPTMMKEIEKVLKRPGWLTRGDYKNGVR